MEDMQLDEQHLHFFSCLDRTLESRLNDVVRSGTPVMPVGSGSGNSCLELLEQEFLNTYPLVQRRHDFFVCKQLPGQKITDFMI